MLKRKIFKKFFIGILIFLLAFQFCIPSFGCSNNEPPKTFVEASVVYTDGDDVTLFVSADGATFKTHVCTNYVTVEVEAVNDNGGLEKKAVAIKSITVKDNGLEIKVPQDNLSHKYFVNISAEATNENLACGGECFVDYKGSILGDPSALLEVANVMGKMTSAFKGIATVATGFVTTMGVFNGVTQILEMVGVLESTDEKIEKLQKEIEKVNERLDKIDAKIDQLSKKIEELGEEILEQTEQILYNTASSGWSDFITGYVVPLLNVKSYYENSFNYYMLNFISNADKVDSLMGVVTYYEEIEGELVATLKQESSDLSIQGNEIKKEQTVFLKLDVLQPLRQKISENSGRLYQGYLEDFQAFIKDKWSTIAGDGSEGITAEDYATKVLSDASLYALNQVGKDEFMNAYVNFCYALGGRSEGSPQAANLKPFEYFNQILSYFYNFKSEGITDLLSMREYVCSLLISMGAVSTFAYDFSPHIATERIYNAFEYAKGIVLAMDVSDGVGEGSQYCYTLKKQLTSKKAYMNYSMNNNEIKVFLTDRENGTTEVSAPSNRITKEQFAKVNKKYSMLRSCGVVNCSFWRYLCNLGFIDANYYNYYKIIMDAPVVKSGFDNNDYVTMICHSIPSASEEPDWYDKIKNHVGVSFGFSGKEINEKYKNNKYLSATVFDVYKNQYFNDAKICIGAIHDLLHNKYQFHHIDNYSCFLVLE